MALSLSQQNSDANLQAAFRRHLPQRLRTLLHRTRLQCRSGWDCNVLRSLHDEIGQLADTCNRCGMPETGQHLSTLESALAPAVAAEGVPDATASTEIDALLDHLNPHLQQTLRATALPAWMQGSPLAAARTSFPPSDVAPAGYGLQLGMADAPALESAAVLASAAPQRPRVLIVNDDDPLISELLLRLEQRGCDVALLERVEDLMQQLEVTPPDLAILVADAATPLEQLATTLRRARRDPTPRVRLLLLLREADVTLRLRALRAGVDRSITLPTPTDDAMDAALELANVEGEPPYRVLIVDDDAPQALFAQAILHHAGMETRVLGESLAVLEELERFQPDLLLLDLNMPDCDGFELTALIRDREGYANTPIVFLSGEEDPDRQFAARDVGADDFLLKPIRPAHLVAAVTNRVRRARAAAARARRAREGGAAPGLARSPQWLDALSAHLAAALPRAATGGLLAVGLHDADGLRRRLGPAGLDEVLEQIGAFILRRVGANRLTTRHQENFLVLAPESGERGLEALASELIAATGHERFGAQASAVRLACAVLAFSTATDNAVSALAELKRRLAAVRVRTDQTDQRADGPALPGEER